MPIDVQQYVEKLNQENLNRTVNLMDINVLRQHDRGCCNKIFNSFDLEVYDEQKFVVLSWLMPLSWIGVFIAYMQYYGLDYINDKINSAQATSWGALVYPIEISRFWTFLSYSIIHLNTWHLLINSLMFVVLAWYLEEKYKWWRLLIISIISSIGAGLLWATVVKYDTIDDTNKVYTIVGASGVCYGLVGTYISETFLNYETIRTKWLRYLTIVLFISAHVYEYIYLYNAIAVFAHLGGLLVGMGPAMLYLPNYKYEKYDTFILLMSSVIYLGLFVGSPLALYYDII